MIIADEPTGNIDPAMSMDIVQLLTEINLRGTTVLMVTHEHELVHAFPQHRLIEIKEGQVVSDSLYADKPMVTQSEEPAAPVENLTVEDIEAVEVEPEDVPMVLLAPGREGGHQE